MDFPAYFALCGAMCLLGKIVLARDLGIAAAYFAIPVGFLIVWRRRLDDLPYPWMLGLFTAFIVACRPRTWCMLFKCRGRHSNTVAEAAGKASCAVLSIGTAIA